METAGNTTLQQQELARTGREPRQLECQGDKAETCRCLRPSSQVWGTADTLPGSPCHLPTTDIPTPPPLGQDLVSRRLLAAVASDQRHTRSWHDARVHQPGESRALLSSHDKDKGPERKEQRSGRRPRQAPLRE
uniref:Uncharacterized protein n=1 Tax=Molossus molossus TaxID=27622 RepID=A0A7J8BLW7_MOLMO|nr:hypothetical protein HJG59_010116 [Molossus molossus]